MTQLRILLHLVALGDISPKDAEREIRAAVALAAGIRYPVTVGNEGFTATIYEIPARSGIVEPYDVRPYIHNRWGLDDGG